MQLSDSLLSDVELQLARTPCPTCGASGMGVYLRCDIGEPDCLFVARCETCGFELSVDRDSYPDLRDVSEIVATCPSCGETETVLTFECKATTRRCAYKRVCAECRATAEIRLSI